MSTKDLGRMLNKARVDDNYKLADKIKTFAEKYDIWTEVQTRSRVRSYVNMNPREQKSANIGFEIKYNSQADLREVNPDLKKDEKRVFNNGEWMTRDEFLESLDEIGLEWLKDLDYEGGELNKMLRRGLEDTWKEVIRRD